MLNPACEVIVSWKFQTMKLQGKTDLQNLTFYYKQL